MASSSRTPYVGCLMGTAPLRTLRDPCEGHRIRELSLCKNQQLTYPLRWMSVAVWHATFAHLHGTHTLERSPCGLGITAAAFVNLRGIHNLRSASESPARRSCSCEARLP